MRFSLVDLSIATACMALGCIAAVIGAHVLDIEGFSLPQMELFGIPIGFVFYFALTPPIYRRFRLMPLLLPVCPHCKQRPTGYWISKMATPRVVVVCGACQRMTELWWTRPVASEISKDTPSLLLCWPQSVGRWRLLSKSQTG